MTPEHAIKALRTLADQIERAPQVMPDAVIEIKLSVHPNTEDQAKRRSGYATPWCNLLRAADAGGRNGSSWFNGSISGARITVFLPYAPEAAEAPAEDTTVEAEPETQAKETPATSADDHREA